MLVTVITDASWKKLYPDEQIRIDKKKTAMKFWKDRLDNSIKSESEKLSIVILSRS